MRWHLPNSYPILSVYITIDFGEDPLTVLARMREGDLLSLLAKRMANVQASGSPSLTSAVAFQTQLRSLPTFGDSFMAGTTVAGQLGFATTYIRRSAERVEMGTNTP